MLTRIIFSLFLTLGLSPSIVAQENKELVGSYLFRFQWGGTELKLQPNGIFISTSSDCTQVFTSSGSYSVTNNVLTFTTKKLSVRSFSDNKEHDLTKRKNRKKYLDTDEPFKPETWDLQIVRWGQRIYLMDQNALGKFIDAINLGFEPREVDGYRVYYGDFLLRVGDENKAIDGRPSLPQEFFENLLSAPIIATILKFETGNVATIDRGSEHGLRKGMFLVTLREESGAYVSDFQPHMIISVEPTSARVQLMETVAPGAKLTTRIANVARL